MLVYRRDADARSTWWSNSRTCFWWNHMSKMAPSSRPGTPCRAPAWRLRTRLTKPETCDDTGGDEQWKMLENDGTCYWLVVWNLFSFSIIYGYIYIYMGCHPSHWLSYFSRWLKPPTRLGLSGIFHGDLRVVDDSGGSQQIPGVKSYFARQSVWFGEKTTLGKLT